MSTGRKRTHDDFVKNVEEILGTEYEVVDRFINTQTYITVLHHICGKSYSVLPNNILTKKSGCPFCRGRKRTSDDFKRIMFDMVGTDFTLLDEYKNATTKMRFLHHACGNITTMNANKFLSGQRCKTCAKKKPRKSTSKFDRQFKEKFGDDYLIISEYNGCHKTVSIEHVCGHAFETTPSILFHGIERKYELCPKCRLINYTPQSIKEKFNGEIELLGDYNGREEECIFYHIKCENIFVAKPSLLLQRYIGCDHCARASTTRFHLKSQEQFEKDIWDVAGNEYSVIGGYVNINTPILMKHNICGFEWEIKPSNFLFDDMRCPTCNIRHMSKAENRIYNFLKSQGIIFIAQYSFHDCRDRRMLPFDFAVLDKLGNIRFLIEYDGAQHYKPFEHYGGEKTFLKLKRRDEIKNRYCVKNGLTLYRIPYWDEDHIETILEELI